MKLANKVLVNVNKNYSIALIKETVITVHIKIGKIKIKAVLIAQFNIQSAKISKKLSKYLTKLKNSWIMDKRPIINLKVI